MSFLSRERLIDSGSGTSVYKLEYPFITLAKKIFDRTGSEEISLADLKSFQRLNNQVATDLAAARPDLITRTETETEPPLTVSWSVNPIYYAGGHRPGHLYTLTPFIEGTSLAEIFQKEIYPLETREFLRKEMVRMARLLNFQYPYFNLHLTALNITLRATSPVSADLVITNLRESVLAFRHPIKIFGRRTIG